MAGFRWRREFIRVREGPEWRRVRTALASENRSLPAKLHREIVEQSEKLAEEARDKVERMPTRGRGSTGLRKRVARGVAVTTAGQGDVRVTTSMPSRDEAIIPRGLDRRAGWEHPVYGNRDVWVRQRPMKPGWFRETFAGGQDDIEDALTDHLEDAADTIASAGRGR